MPEIQRYPIGKEALALCDKLDDLLEGERATTVILTFAIQILSGLQASGGKPGTIPLLERELQDLINALIFTLDVSEGPVQELSRMRPAGGTQ